MRATPVWAGTNDLIFLFLVTISRYNEVTAFACRPRPVISSQMILPEIFYRYDEKESKREWHASARVMHAEKPIAVIVKYKYSYFLRNRQILMYNNFRMKRFILYLKRLILYWCMDILPIKRVLFYFQFKIYETIVKLCVPAT